VNKISEILPQQLYRDTDTNVSSSNSIELPEVVDQLIDNKMYRNKFKKLVREGHLQDLLDLATVAMTKNRPSRWFATVTAKARFSGTLIWLQKCRQVTQLAREVASRLSAGTQHMRAIYKACWRRNDVVRHAVTASEVGRDPFKLFCYLSFKT
jgi:hypothetical protein